LDPRRFTAIKRTCGGKKKALSKKGNEKFVKHVISKAMNPEGMSHEEKCLQPKFVLTKKRRYKTPGRKKTKE